MGVLQTPNRKFLAPDGNDPVPSGHEIHRFTSEALDKIFGDPGPFSYSPQITNASEEELNIGDTGTATGRWYRLLEEVFVEVVIVLGGSGINLGSSPIHITLPTPASGTVRTSDEIGVGVILGAVDLRDNSLSANSQIAVAGLRTASKFMIGTGIGTTTRLVSATEPFIWATGDSISAGLRYRGVFT